LKRDLHAAPANLDDLLVDFRDREERMDRGLFAFAFDQLEDRAVGGGVVIDLQSFPRELAHDFLNRGRFVQLDEFAAPAAGAVRLHDCRAA
jgi:hypothetical protein